MYPTFAERQQFASAACDYVDDAIALEKTQISQEEESGGTLDSNLAAVVSFSFVNQDLRDYFRQRFPQTKWVLINTTEMEADLRIQQRENHFYKGKDGAEGKIERELPTKDIEENTKEDNPDWEFDPVDFEHISLDGKCSIDQNAKQVLDIILETAA